MLVQKCRIMKPVLSTCLFIVLVNICNTAMAQGCSDAGFCTIGNLAQQSGKHRSKNNFSLQLPVGVGDEGVIVFTPALQYDRTFNGQWSFQTKITANYADGNLGSAAAPGDLYLSGTYIFPSQKNWKWSTTLGSKILLNQSNLKENNLSLPMQYQSSLGTVDVIAGLSVFNEHWQFSTGLQQPLTGTNGNNFLPVYWAVGSKAQEAAAYIPTNDFNRKGDVLARGSYKKKLNEKFSFDAGLLAIYHLGEDTYIDGNVSSRPINIKGSDGLTLNASAACWLKLGAKLTLGLTAAVPLVVRDVRPDGLTREFVIAPEISWNF